MDTWRPYYIAIDEGASGSPNITYKRPNAFAIVNTHLSAYFEIK